MNKNRLFVCLIFLFISVHSYAQIIHGIGYTVDVLPTNIGGKAEFKRVFDQELIYPAKALKNKIGGKVTVNFTVKKDSLVTSISTVTSGVPELDAEALRLFNLYQWVPAIKNGNYVTANWSCIFEFNPDKYSKICRERGFVNPEYLKDEVIDSTINIVHSPEQFPMYLKGNYV